MKKKILMVSPKSPDTFWSFRYSLEFIGKKSNFPPLGLMTVASLLPPDYEIKLVDMNVENLSEKDITDSDIVFISAMIIQKESMTEVIKLCNRLGKPVALGGPYPSSSHDRINGVDHFILNEAEVTLPLFLSDYENGNARELYRTDIKPDITRTPPPRFDLIKLNLYSSMSLQYSRGCPFNCEFCDIIELFGRVPRTKTSSQFINEINSLYNSGYRGSVFIVDDNFIGNKAHVKDLLKAIVPWQAEKNFPFLFFTEASVNLAQDEEMMDLMKSAGFTMVFMGIETPVEASLVLTNKQQNIKNSLLESVKTIQAKGIEVTGGFILGFDNDPENIADLQIDFIQKSGISTAMVGLLTALPNTQLYRRLEKEGRLLAESAGNNTLALDLNFKTVMNRNKLINAYKKVINTIYKPKFYFQRSWTFIERLPSDSRISIGKTSWSTRVSLIIAFFRSLRKQLLSPYGLDYFRFLAKTILHKPSLFAKSAQMAIFGHHFFKMVNIEISRKSRTLETFKVLLYRNLKLLRKTYESITFEGLKKSFYDLLYIRKKVLPEILVKHVEISGISNEKIESAVHNFYVSVNRVISNLEDFFNSNNRQHDNKILKKALKKIEVFQSRHLTKIAVQAKGIESEISDISRDLLWNLKSSIDEKLASWVFILRSRLAWKKL